MPESKWLFVVKADDRPGALSSVASVFANLGLSVRMTVGSGLLDARREGALLFVLQASDERRRMLERTVLRLSKVHEVVSYPYDSSEIRAVAVIQMPHGCQPLDGAKTEVQAYPLAELPTRSTWLLAGMPGDVERLLASLAHERRVLDFTIIVTPV